MIISDFECKRCKKVHEAIVSNTATKHNCPICGRPAKRIISLGKVYTGNQDADWIKSVVDVVDKESPRQHVRDFVKNPNRETYKAWMKGEGIKPMDYTEHGAPPVARKPPDPDLSGLTQRLVERHRERNRLEVKGGRDV